MTTTLTERCPHGRPYSPSTGHAIACVPCHAASGCPHCRHTLGEQADDEGITVEELIRQLNTQGAQQ